MIRRMIRHAIDEKSGCSTLADFPAGFPYPLSV
jgi:hypothetical protein